MIDDSSLTGRNEKKLITPLKLTIILENYGFPMFCMLHRYSFRLSFNM